jgi:hypothetical protein
MRVTGFPKYRAVHLPRNKKIDFLEEQAKTNPITEEQGVGVLRSLTAASFAHGKGKAELLTRLPLDKFMKQLNCRWEISKE